MYTSFSVYEDFPCYSQGIYNHVYGEKIGRHAAKLIGWGIDSNYGEYWIA